MSARLMTSTSFIDNLFLLGKLCLDTALVSRIFLIMNAFFPNLRSEMQDRQWIFLEVWVRIRLALELWSTLNMSLMHHTRVHGSQQTPYSYYVKIFTILVKLKNNISIWLEVKSLSRVWLFATPWTVAYWAPPSMGFSRQEHWSGLPFPSPEDFPDKGWSLDLPHCRQTLYSLSHKGSPVIFLHIFPNLP